MPSHLIHLTNARRFLAVSNIVNNKENFLMGAISPDIKSEKLKENSHYKPLNKDNEADYFDKWEQNIIDFYLYFKGKIDNDFLLGYVFHLYGDWTFEKNYEQQLLKTLQIKKHSSGENPQEFEDTYINEFLGYDAIIYKTSYFNNEVVPILENAIEKTYLFPQDFSIINNCDIQSLIKSILGNYQLDCNGHKPKYLNEKIVEDYYLWTIAFFKNGL